MAVRDPTKASTELDKLAAIEPDEDHIEYIKTLVARDDKVHVEVHMAALEGDYPKPVGDTPWAKAIAAVRAAL